MVNHPDNPHTHGPYRPQQQQQVLPPPAAAAPFFPAHHRDWTCMTRTIAHYERLEQIGEGTYGQVYRARCKDTNQIVALKKIRVHHGGYWGMPPTVIREIKILKRLRHENLVSLVEVVSSKGVEHLDEDDEVEEKHKVKESVNHQQHDKILDAREGYKGNLFLVLEYISHDLTGLMDVTFRFTEVQVKVIFRQLLKALEYMHEQKYVHRDIKSSNILIDSFWRVKLADFGLARCIEPPIMDNLQE
jgi:serine/threonine protein kinase